MKFLRIIVAGILTFIGCQNQDKASFDGPGSASEIKHVEENWEVKVPVKSFTYIKSSSGLVLYLSTHEALKPFQESIQRQWNELKSGEFIKHPEFFFNGDSDTKVKYSTWVDKSQKMKKFIVIDYSTGTVAFIEESWPL